MKTRIMAIGNVTPDSFYAASRLKGEEAIVSWARQSVADGASILDIGGCSTRPGSTPVSAAEEWERIAPAIEAVRNALPEVQLSVDTFRPEIAQQAIASFGSLIINDISGGCEAMYALVREKKIPYIWTLRGDLELPGKHPEMSDLELILDPGFGFIGSTEADYACMRSLDRLRDYGREILVGISRKSMVYRPLGLTPESCLTPTQALQLYAIEHGATILRTHDVAATRQTIQLFNQLEKICIS